jgi:hypothetical protein
VCDSFWRHFGPKNVVHAVILVRYEVESLKSFLPFGVQQTESGFFGVRVYFGLLADHHFFVTRIRVLFLEVGRRTGGILSVVVICSRPVFGCIDFGSYFLQKFEVLLLSWGSS